MCVTTSLRSWDLSVGEHLQPGETYEHAAYRGLEEELGIKAEAGALRRVRPPHLNR